MNTIESAVEKLNLKEVEKKDLNNLWKLAFKRFLDIVISSFGLLLISPILILTSLAIKLDSEGPILFKQVRVGKNGRLFTFYKFRSMVENAELLKDSLKHLNEMDGPCFKIKNDPRVTKVGRFLRKTSIDELPQLWNVLKGEMSLVGPRPLPLEEVVLMESWHLERLNVIPGITGLWQVNGRNNLSFHHWMELDIEYVRRWSIWLDLKLLLKTIPVVLLRIGAC
jgi:exopolysaccharide biosynthesis polyprenyl glycosylphosphotransferase